MRKLSLLLLFFAFAYQGSAQLKPVFREDFSTNSNKWITGEITNLAVKVSDGKYTIDSKLQNTVTPQVLAGVDSARDFTISVSIKTLVLNGTAEYGVLFGSNKYAYYCFAATPKGEYVLYSVTHNTIHEIIPVKKTPHLFPGVNQVNKLGIKKSGNHWYLMVNDFAVDTTDARRFFGPFMGVAVENAKTEFDDFIINGTPVTTSGNVCTLFPLIFQSAKNNFEYIKGEQMDKYDTTMFSTSVQLTEDKNVELDLFPEKNLYYAILKDDHKTSADAARYNDNLVIQYRKCLPGYVFTKSTGVKGFPQYTITEKVKSTGIQPLAVLGISQAEHYMSTLNIISIPVKSLVPAAVPVQEKKPASAWIINEEFKNNDNKWRIDSNSQLRCSMNGEYYINSYTPEPKIVLHPFSLPVNGAHDYKIETRIKNFREKNNDPFGIVFGNHGQHAFYFLITNNGTFAIKETNDTAVIVLKNFTFHRAVRPSQNGIAFYNKLSIIKLKQTWSFRINDEEVYTCDARPLGENFGFWVTGNTLLEVSCFKIYDWTIADGLPDQPKENIYRNHFYDDLWTNQNSWDVLNNSNTVSSFTGLDYQVDHKSDGYFMPALSMPALGINDFRVELMASHKSGDLDKQYGICFGKKDIDNAYIFTIGANGTYEIGKFIDGNWSSIYRGDADVIYKGNYTTNTLAVEQSKGKWFFSINGKLVHTFYSTTLPGTKAGCYVEGNQKVGFENMSYAEIEYRDN